MLTEECSPQSGQDMSPAAQDPHVDLLLELCALPESLPHPPFEDSRHDVLGIGSLLSMWAPSSPHDVSLPNFVHGSGPCALAPCVGFIAVPGGRGNPPTRAHSRPDSAC
jgi:hypothetical protein